MPLGAPSGFSHPIPPLPPVPTRGPNRLRQIAKGAGVLALPAICCGGFSTVCCGFNPVSYVAKSVSDVLRTDYVDTPAPVSTGPADLATPEGREEAREKTEQCSATDDAKVKAAIGRLKMVDPNVKAETLEDIRCGGEVKSDETKIFAQVIKPEQEEASTLDWLSGTEPPLQEPFIRLTPTLLRPDNANGCALPVALSALSGCIEAGQPCDYTGFGASHLPGGEIGLHAEKVWQACRKGGSLELEAPAAAPETPAAETPAADAPAAETAPADPALPTPETSPFIDRSLLFAKKQTGAYDPGDGRSFVGEFEGGTFTGTLLFKSNGRKAKGQFEYKDPTDERWYGEKWWSGPLPLNIQPKGSIEVTEPSGDHFTVEFLEPGFADYSRDLAIYGSNNVYKYKLGGERGKWLGGYPQEKDPWASCTPLCYIYTWDPGSFDLHQDTMPVVSLRTDCTPQ